MTEKQKLSDETIKKVAGGDVVTNMWCPVCHGTLMDGPGRFYCNSCDYYEKKS